MKEKKLSDKAKAKQIAAIKAHHYRKGMVGVPPELAPDEI
jgi:hypothetical protein